MSPKARSRVERRSSAELRELLIQAGLKVLYRRGLRATASHVPMGEAVEQLEADHGLSPSMGSIFGAKRLWPSVREYQLDVFAAALLDTDNAGPNGSSSTMIEFLPEVRDRPIDERIATLVDVCRLAGLMNGYVEASEPEIRRTWLTWVSIWALVMSDESAGDRLEPLLRQGELDASASFMELYRVMFERLGVELKDGYTLEQFTTLAAALTDGVALRTRILPERTGEATSPHPGEWNVLGTGLAAVALEYLRPLPDPVS